MCLLTQDKDADIELQLAEKVVIVPPGMDPEVFVLPDSHEANQARFREKVGGFIETSKSRYDSINVMSEVEMLGGAASVDMP